MSLPSVIALEYLHRRYAKDEKLFAAVYTHCQIVWSIARELMAQRALDVDAELVRVGALVHDIGVYRIDLERSYIRHGAVGFQILKNEGFDRAICRFAACHMGMGITREEIEARGLPLPPADYVPKTDEERLVMYADKFHDTFKVCFENVETIREGLARFGPDKVAVFDEFTRVFGVPDLPALAAQFEQKIV